MSIIDEIFRPVYGKPCWQVRQGYGSFLTFEFGEPSLHIQEPRHASARASEKIKKNAARRHITLHGEWHLWVYLSEWRIFLHGQEIASHTSTRLTIKKAIAELEGQLLTQVTVTSSLSVFEFDLGGKLEIAPDHEEKELSDIWLLFEPSSDVFILRSDGQYCHMPENTSPEMFIWQPLDISNPLS